MTDSRSPEAAPHDPPRCPHGYAFRSSACGICYDEETDTFRAEAAPPRATTPEPMTGPFMEKRRAELWQTMPAAFPSVPRDVLERAIDAQVHFDLGVSIGERRALLAASPSRESGALLDDLAVAVRREVLRPCEVTTRQAADARAAVDRRLSTLERDAARMREALEALGAAADDVNNRYIGGSGLNGRLGSAIEWLAQENARAAATLRALAPSGDPTPTEEPT